MFNKALFVLVLMTLSGTVLSAPPTASLAISGSITPPTCTLNGQAEETYTYRFNISPGLFPASGDLSLTPQTQNIEVICDATTYLTVSATDERAGTEWVTGQYNLGLGTYDTDTKIGFYGIRMDTATVKTNPDASATKIGIIRASSYATFYQLITGWKHSWATSDAQMAAAQIFAADFTVIPTINNAMKNSAGDAELDGLAILTFTFAI